MALRLGRIGPTISIVAGLLIVTAPTPVQASDTWRRVDTPNFVLFGDVKPDQLVEAGKQIEMFRDVVTRTTSGLINPSADPMTIYVFRDTSLETYGAWLKTDPSRFGVFVVGDPHLGVDASGKTTLAAFIRHEYVHTVLRDTIPDAPVCIEEGLAEFYSTVYAVPGQPTAVLGAANPQRLAELRRSTLLPIDRLLAIHRESPEYEDKQARGRFYAQCWGLTHWLIVPDDGRRERFVEFLGRIRRGEPTLEAFRAALEISPETIDKELSTYVGSETLGPRLFTLDSAIVDRELRAMPISKAETFYREGDLVAHFELIPSPAIEEHFRAALNLEPSRVDVQLDLAGVYARRSKWDIAAAMYEGALKKGGNTARVRYGQMLLSRAEILNSIDQRPKDVARARQLFREVLAASPDDLSALSGLASSFDFGTEDRSEGIAAITRARRLMPSKIDFMQVHIDLLADSGRFEEAAAVFGELRARTTAFSFLHRAEWGVAGGASQYAKAHFESGDKAGALAALYWALALVQFPELRSHVAGALERYGAPASERPHLARYREGVDALRNKETEKALALFDRVAAESSDPALQKVARETARDVRPTVTHERVIARYRAAMDLTKAGDIAGATSALEALLVEYSEMAETERARITADLGNLRTSNPNAGGTTLGSKAPPLKLEGNKVVRTADEMEMVTIPAGSFRMGSEVHVDDGTPIHRVRISRDFLMDRHEVTVEQFGRVMWQTPEGQSRAPNAPIVNVAWKDAREYCDKVGGRLPTEAEWEYAARGGLKGKKYPWGDEKICEGEKCRANFCDRNCETINKDNSSNDGYGEASPVCHYRQSGYGLCDMIGNVREWVGDWYEKYSGGEATDPTGPPSGEKRVSRGGSWVFFESFLSVANRFPILPGERFDDLGFRCVRDAEPRQKD